MTKGWRLQRHDDIGQVEAGGWSAGTLLEALLDGSVAPHAFDHRAHVFAGWLAMQRYGVDEGKQAFRIALRAYCVHLGAPEKYHVTITEAMLSLIAAQIDRQVSEGELEPAWLHFANRAAHLLESSKACLAPFYTTALIESDRARREYVEPDIGALLPATTGERADVTMR
jgi:N-formylglutamate deformylase